MKKWLGIISFVWVIGEVNFAIAHDEKDPIDKPFSYWGGNEAKLSEFSSHNIELKAWMPATNFNNGYAAYTSDCWGYVSESGREYAIVGYWNGTAFVDITKPESSTEPYSPEVIATIPGPSGFWRDIKIYQNYAYLVSDSYGQEYATIQIVDLSNIDEGEVNHLEGVYYDISEYGSAVLTHNVAINKESGYLYRAGGGQGLQGLHIYDLSNPEEPELVAEWHERYVHDLQVVTYHSGPYEGKEVAFLFSSDYDGDGHYHDSRVDILDVTDKADITTLSYVYYSYPAFAHQGWLSEDYQYLYVGDEYSEVDYELTTTTPIIDVSDLEDPVEVNTFTNGVEAISHNMYAHNDLLFQANYESGLRVLNIVNPEEPVEVAYFDTYPEATSVNFNGLWGNYPFFPSGLIIGSDLQNGLFVWELDLPEADITGDGVVNGEDLGVLLSQWGESGSQASDLNEDGLVDGADLGILLSEWTE